jgi:hypothetical protein
VRASASVSPAIGECVVELAVCEQSRIGRDHGAAKLQHQSAVEIELENLIVCFTRWVRHRYLDAIQDKVLMPISELPSALRKPERHPGDVG